MRNGIVSITSLQNPYKDKKNAVPWRNLAGNIFIKVPSLTLYARGQIEIAICLIEWNEGNTMSFFLILLREL